MISGKRQLLLHRFVSVIILLIWSQISIAKNLHVEVDPADVEVGERFQINVIFDDQYGSKPPEPIAQFDPALQVVRGPSVQMTHTSINGASSYSTIWSWEAVANSPGNYTIPPFQLQSYTSSPVKLKVTGQAPSAQNGTAAGNLEEVMIRYETSTSEALVGEQILLKWKVLFSAKLTGAIEPASLPLNFEKTLLEPINGKNHVETIQGVPYEVKEFHQVVFATEAGSFTLDPIVFNGKMRPRNQRFGAYQPIRLQSEPLKITIKPLDKSALNNEKNIHNRKKIPVTDKLTIATQWGIPTHAIDVGDPITLEVNMSAPGQLPSRLPDIKLKDNKALKIYSDGDESRQNSNWTSGITGYRVQKFAIIPQEPGTFEIPATRIAWWNTSTQKMEITEIPGESIQVRGKPGSQSTAGQNSTANTTTSSDQFQDFNELTNLDDEATTDEASSTDDTDKSKSTEDEDKTDLWQNLTLIILILWAFTMIYGYKFVMRRQQKKQEASEAKQSDLAKESNTDTTSAAPNAKQSNRKIQLDLVPLFEVNQHDMSSRDQCIQIINRLCIWVEQQTGQKPSNITQLIDAIAPEDPWQPLLQECEHFLYAGQDHWPRQDMKEQLVKGLPVLDLQDKSETKIDKSDEELPDFIPKGKK